MSTKALPQQTETNAEDEGSKSSTEDLFHGKDGIAMGDVATAFGPSPNYVPNAGELLMIDPTDIPLPQQPGIGNSSIIIRGSSAASASNGNSINPSIANAQPAIEPVNIVVSSNNRNNKGGKKKWWGNKQETPNPLQKNLQSHQELMRMKSASEVSTDIQDGNPSPQTHPHSPISSNSTGIVYVQKDNNRSSNYKTVCFALIFGVLLMYAIMLTYMVFIDPKTMVCNKICGAGDAGTNNNAVTVDDDIGPATDIGGEPIPSMAPTEPPSNNPSARPSAIPSMITVSPTKSPSPNPTGTPY